MKRCELVKPIIGITGVVFVALAFLIWVERRLHPIDDSDASPDHRSGMQVHTDCKTGLQYLSTPYGGITPRRDVDGSQVVAPCNMEGRAP